MAWLEQGATFEMSTDRLVIDAQPDTPGPYIAHNAPTHARAYTHGDPASGGGGAEERQRERERQRGGRQRLSRVAFVVPCWFVAGACCPCVRQRLACPIPAVEATEIPFN